MAEIYENLVNLDTLEEYNEGINQRIDSKMEGLRTAVKDMSGIYFSDTEPDADTYTWFAPYDPKESITVDGQLNLGEYTGDESKLHIEVTETGELFTAENTSVTTDGDTATVIIQ